MHFHLLRGRFDFRRFCLDGLFDGMDVFISELLHLFFVAFQHIFRLSTFLGITEGIHGFFPGMSDGNFGLLPIFSYDFGQLIFGFVAEFGYVDEYRVRFPYRRHAQRRFEDGFFHGLQGAWIEDGHAQRLLSFGDDGCDFFEFALSPVHVHEYPFQHGGRGSSDTQRFQFLLQRFLGPFHVFFGTIHHVLSFPRFVHLVLDLTWISFLPSLGHPTGDDVGPLQAPPPHLRLDLHFSFRRVRFPITPGRTCASPSMRRVQVVETLSLQHGLGSNRSIHPRMGVSSLLGKGRRSTGATTAIARAISTTDVHVCFAFRGPP